MKKAITVLLALLLLLNLTAAVAENSAGGDYSWLDDLTIKQLKELDEEIHKRIPYEGETVSPVKGNNAVDILLGQWECIVRDYNSPKDYVDYGDEFRYTLEFYEAGFGKVGGYNLTKDRVDSDNPCTYEMTDDSTVVLKINSLFGEVTSGYKLQEDEAGPCLIKIGDETKIYHKVRE